MCVAGDDIFENYRDYQTGCCGSSARSATSTISQVGERSVHDIFTELRGRSHQFFAI
jgi:hypothetical protein